jgi:sterol desaturase/sphingolipid hydroxylase (fatty acid hydroxylase superfamily)
MPTPAVHRLNAHLPATIDRGRLLLPARLREFLRGLQILDTTTTHVAALGPRKVRLRRTARSRGRQSAHFAQITSPARGPLPRGPSTATHVHGAPETDDQRTRAADSAWLQPSRKPLAMSVVDLLLYACAAVFPLFFVIERLWPARRQPHIAGWPLIGTGFFIAYALIAVLLPLALPASWFEAGLLPGAELGIAGGAVVGYLATTLAGYIWHRAAHRVPLLWRVFHQMHHAPQRLDAAGAFVFHPTEAVLYTLLGLAVNALLLGLDPVAASIVGFAGVFNAVFQHANLRTPRFLAWLIQRPEAHSIHHAHGVHGWNYSDFPLWDIVFGTYRAAIGFQPHVGFDRAPSRRWGAMLMFRDVHEPDYRQPPLPVVRAEL